MCNVEMFLKLVPHLFFFPYYSNFPQRNREEALKFVMAQRTQSFPSLFTLALSLLNAKLFLKPGKKKKRNYKQEYKETFVRL